MHLKPDQRTKISSQTEESTDGKAVKKQKHLEGGSP